MLWSHVTYLGGLVLGGGNKVCTVVRPLEIGDGLVKLVDGNVVEEVAVLAVELGDGAVFVAGNDVLAEVTPASDSGLAVLANDSHGLLIALLGVNVELDVEDNDGTQMTHALLRHTQKLAAILAELNALDGGREVPCLKKSAGLDLPKADGVVGRTGGEDGGCGVDINGPDGTLVAVVCTETLAVVREPNANLLVLGN